ncbi:MAG: hypothetical protein KDD37_09175, partial [Bdellovibrionales bacterium]|nr:hypothetical protein [Bdellovibrionales bacterium]
METQTKRLIQSSNDLEAALGANPSARNLAPLMRSITSGIKGMDRMVQLSEFLILEDPKENKKPFDFDLLCMTLYELLNSELITKSIAMEFQVQGDGVIQVQPGMFSKLVYYHLVDLIECINHTDEPKIKLELVS